MHMATHNGQHEPAAMNCCQAMCQRIWAHNPQDVAKVRVINRACPCTARRRIGRMYFQSAQTLRLKVWTPCHPVSR